MTMVSNLRTIVLGRSVIGTAYGLTIEPGLVWPAAQPDDHLDYSLDASAELEDVAATLQTIQVSVSPAGAGELAVGNIAFANGVITLLLGGGQPGRRYTVKIEGAAPSTPPRQFEWQVSLAIVSASLITPPTPPQIPGFGPPVTWTANGLQGSGGGVLTGEDDAILTGGVTLRQIAGVDVVTALGAGAAGQILTSNGGTLTPTWQANPGTPKAYVDAAVAAVALTAGAAGTVAAAALPRSGGTLTGPLLLATDPVAPGESATRRYVDSGDATNAAAAAGALTVAQAALPRAGGTMAGPIVLSGAPTAALHPTTRAYVDSADAANASAAAAAQATANAALPRSGGTLTGPLLLVEDPVAPLEAATRRYVDALTGFGMQGTAAANTATTVLTPAKFSSMLVLVSAASTIDVGPGFAGQVFRVELKQDATGNHAVTLGSTIVFGPDLPSYRPSTSPNTRDLLQLIYAGGGSWMCVAISHGFGV